MHLSMTHTDQPLEGVLRSSWVATVPAFVLLLFGDEQPDPPLSTAMTSE